MPTLHNHLPAPVVVITKGRGVELFDDSRRLFARLEEIQSFGDSILSIRQGERALAEHSLAALAYLVEFVGWAPFKRACIRRGNPWARFGTRWSWTALGDYLGFDWRDL
jgi:hypothetical protein